MAPKIGSPSVMSGSSNSTTAKSKILTRVNEGLATVEQNHHYAINISLTPYTLLNISMVDPACYS